MSSRLSLVSAVFGPGQGKHGFADSKGLVDLLHRKIKVVIFFFGLSPGCCFLQQPCHWANQTRQEYLVIEPTLAFGYYYVSCAPQPKVWRIKMILLVMSLACPILWWSSGSARCASATGRNCWQLGEFKRSRLALVVTEQGVRTHIFPKFGIRCDYRRSNSTKNL